MGWYQFTTNAAQSILIFIIWVLLTYPREPVTTFTDQFEVVAEYEETEGEEKKGLKRYKKISLRIEGIPSSKIADLNRGVLMPISREVGGFEFNMEIDINKPEGVSETTIKNKVKETISQIGAKITKEEIK